MGDFDFKKNKVLYYFNKLIEYITNLILKVLNKLFSKRLPIEKLEKSRILSNTLGLLIFNFIGGFLLIVTNVKLANVLGAAVFGLYSYYLAIGEVGQNFVRYGRHKTMVRDLVQKPEKSNELITNTIALAALNLVIYVVVVLAFRKPLDVDVSFVTLCLLIAPCLIALDFQPVYESLKLMSWHSIYLVLQKLLFLAFIWTFIFFGKISLPIISVLLFLSWIVILIPQYIEITNHYKLSWKSVNFASLKYLYKDNFFIALSCMVGVAWGPYIRLILKNTVDAAAVGIYSAGLQLFLVSTFILHQVGRVGNPMMAEIGKEDCPVTKRRKTVRNYSLIMLASAIPFALPLCIIPHQITKWLFSAEYAPLGETLPLFALYIVSLAIGIVFAQFLISLRKDRLYFTIYTSGAILTVILGLLIIPPMGVMGAVITLCVPHSIACILYGVFSIRYLK